GGGDGEDGDPAARRDAYYDGDEVAPEGRQNVAHSASCGIREAGAAFVRSRAIISPGGAAESVAPPGLYHVAVGCRPCSVIRRRHPTARAVGYILTPLRGCTRQPITARVQSIR